MLVFTKKDIKFAGLMALIVILSITMPITLNSVKNENNELKETMAELSNNQITIIVDAGHGEPDGGAVSNDGIKESVLNLQIAKKLEELLNKNDFNVIMTRETDNNIGDSDKQNAIRKMKVSDINNRLDIINNSGANFVISIHMNKYTNPKYKGWQTFYSNTSEVGKKLAVLIQTGIGEIVNIPNNRTALKIEGIKLVDKSVIPVVIVECGFLSNEEEKNLLITDDYQNKIAEGIVCGISKFLNR